MTASWAELFDRAERHSWTASTAEESGHEDTIERIREELARLRVDCTDERGGDGDA